MGGRGSSRFITILHRGGSPQFITILHRGGLQNLLQYYSFERKMEGYNPFSALNKLKGFHFILFNADLCLRVLSRIRKNVANTLRDCPTEVQYFFGVWVIGLVGQLTTQVVDGVHQTGKGEWGYCGASCPRKHHHQ